MRLYKACDLREEGRVESTTVTQGGGTRQLQEAVLLLAVQIAASASSSLLIVYRAPSPGSSSVKTTCIQPE